MITGGQSAVPIGYLPHSSDLSRPVDRRRFPRYAEMRGLAFDLVSDWGTYRTVVLSTTADITQWVTAPGDCRVIVDLPDSFLDEGWSPKRAARGLAKWVGGEVGRPILSYRRAMQRMLERADAVVCSTDDQAERITPHNANVHPILDLHGEFECLSPVAHESRRLDLVWEGLTATLPAVEAILPALRSVARELEVRLHLVTDLESPRYMNKFLLRRTENLVADWGIEVELHQWGIKTLTEVSRRCGIAIVPVDLTDPMAVGKPENRMRIFWRLGVPVVASASPANVRAASLAGLDKRTLCSTNSDWENTLKRLHALPEERITVASAGQEVALTAYSEESLACRWDRLFDSL